MRNDKTIDLAANTQREYERIKKQFLEAERIFRLDFKYEIQWFEKDRERQQSASHQKEEALIDDDIRETLGSSLKKLRNSLAKQIHPDLNIDDEEKLSEFKKVQEAYEKGEMAVLIESASNHGLNVDLSINDIAAIDKITNKQMRFIKSKKESIKWFWMMSDRTNQTRFKVWKPLGITGDFISWLESWGESLESLELEAVARSKGFKPIQRVYRERNTTRRDLVHY